MAGPQTSLSDDEEQLLRTFQKRVAELADSGLANSGVSRVTVQLLGDEPGLSGYDEDQLFAFCTKLRQFVLQRDAVQFERVSNLISKHCDRAKLKSWAAHYRSNWEQIWSSSLGIGVEDKTYTTKEFFDLFMNSGVTHSNPEKEAALDAMPPAAPDILMMMFQARLRGLCQVLQLQARVVWHWLDDPTSTVPPQPSSGGGSAS